MLKLQFLPGLLNICKIVLQPIHCEELARGERKGEGQNKCHIAIGDKYDEPLELFAKASIFVHVY